MHTKLYRFAILTLLLATMLAAGGAISGRASAASRTDGGQVTAARHMKFAKRTHQPSGYLTVRHYAQPAARIALRARTAQPVGDVALRARTAQPVGGIVLRPRTAQPTGDIALRARTAQLLGHVTLARR